MVTHLKRERLAKGLTQDELSAKANIPQQQISKLEKGRATAPRWDMVFRLARALRVKPETLFPVEP
jgi:transcriptional regulator with XRE-family HTH domain